MHIDIQLAPVETCGCAEGYSKDATEIHPSVHDLPSAVYLSDLVDKQFQGGV